MGFSALERQQARGAVPVGAALTVRPPRVAVLVPLLDWDWRSLFESALATQCGLWGGEGNIVLPWDEGQVNDPVFWKMLRCHDPDILAAYVPSLGELVLIDEASYNAKVEGINASLATLGGISEDQRREYLDNRLAEETTELDLGGSFELVRKRLSVLDADADLPVGWFSLQGMREPKYPFTDMKSLGTPVEVVEDPVCGLGETARLLLGAHVGRLPPWIRRWLEDEQCVNQRDVSRLSAWLPLVSGRLRERSQIFPWDFSRRGVAWYSFSGRERQVVMVVGDEPMDFALFYLLLRVNQQAFWLPREGIREDYLAEYNQSVLSNVVQAAGQLGAQEILVTSVSAGDWRDQLARELQTKVGNDGMRFCPVEPAQVLPSQPSRLLEKDAQGYWGELMLDLTGNSQSLATPLPRHVRSADPFALRWITDVCLNGWTPISHSRLGPQILKAPHTSVRLAATGPAYLCPLHTGFGGESLESLTTRPTLARLDLVEQIQRVISADGWRAKASDKGTYAEQTALLFRGLESLWDALLQEPTRALLDCYFTKGVGHEFRDRVYLRMEDAPAGVDAELYQCYEMLGILRRGLALKCEQCRQGDFYELESVGRSFRCRRCGLDQTHGPEHWLGEQEPKWHFGLAEVVYQFLRNDGDIPVQAIRILLEGSHEPWAVAFELEFEDAEGCKSEHDLVLSYGSRLIIGEATANDRIQKQAKREVERLKRLAAVADLLEADAVVLATTHTHFKEATVKRAREIVEQPWRPLELVESLKRNPD
jgi:hypothetical protein